jgi:N utilization substance protein B
MGNRRKAREASLQLLYEIDLGNKDSRETIQEFLKNPPRIFEQWAEPLGNSEEIVEFTAQITQGVWSNVREIDQLIEMHSTHWKISRMALVDRNILRMAVFEFLYCSDIPASVTINEAIEIAKKFGTEESGAFVNGVLDHIAKELKKM